MPFSPLWLAYGRVLADAGLEPFVRREILAGLTTMRALERTIAAVGPSAGATAREDAVELRDAASSAVGVLDVDTRGRAALRELVRALAAALAAGGRPDGAVPVPLLDAAFAYGDALLHTSVPLAAQAHASLLAYVDEEAHGAAALPWRLRGARLDAMIPEQAETPGIERYAALARRHRSAEHRLLARLYRGMHALNRGNLPAAGRVLRRVVDAARRRELRHVEGRARHLLGCLRGRQRRYAEAVASFHAAVGIVEPDFRENVMMNLVEGLMDLGQHEVARDACLFLAERARAVWVRDGARITLLELAGRARDAAEVRRRFAELAAADFTPETAIWMRAEAAKAFRAIGELDLARQQGELALEIAERFGFRQKLMEAEAFLQGLEAVSAQAEEESATVGAPPLPPAPVDAEAMASLTRLRVDVERWRAQPGHVAEVVAV